MPLGVRLLAILLLGGCTEPTHDLACALLAPGALELHPEGSALTPDRPVSGTAPRGVLVAHPVSLAPGESLTVKATSTRALELIAYGPRNAFGGFPHCSALEVGTSPRVTLESAEGGEFLVLIGPLPGEDALTYTLETSCKTCIDAPRCPTLSDLGCPDIRCDGELERVDGCLTCTCSKALCGPDRGAGPAGSCTLPACVCDDDDPVCGADHRTYKSPCEAACAGVPVAKSGPCDIACPLTCDTPCFGLRTLGEDGCPTCNCLPAFAPDSPSCEACPLTRAPVCGSDGVTYPNACRARCAGAKLLYLGACTNCRTAPPGCDLDCALGLRPVEGGTHCLACACAAPSAACDLTSESDPLCATLPGLGETTVGSACAALTLGATPDTTLWGPCGLRCENDSDCPERAHCPVSGYLAHRCLLDTPDPCGCSPILEPVCGSDGATWDNACLARCAGLEVVHDGECCGTPPACEDYSLDARGCPATCGIATADCADNAATATSCLEDGTPSADSACQAHARGEPSFPEFCP